MTQEQVVAARMTPSERPLVEMRDLRVYFYSRSGLFRTTTVKAVDGVSLALRRGETVAVVGESGSGKTTLGRASLRLVEPAGGSVLFGGEDITHVPGEALQGFRRRAQVIFQDPFSSINPYMSVSELVGEPLQIHHLGGREERGDRVAQALEEVRLTPVGEFLKRYPHMLSGGQRQRVAMARALVLAPEYIVADEPTSMIDASSRAELLYLLRDLQKQRGITYLYITHDIASARHFADRIAVMYLGTVVEVGAAERIIEHPLHPYTRALIEAVPEPDPANRSRERAVVPGEPPSAAPAPSGCPFHPRCPSFIKGTCEVARPPLLEVEPGVMVACYLYPEEKKGGMP